MERGLIRQLWVLTESYHAVVYFAPEKVEAYKAAGLKGGWMGYFASRAAPMGPVGAAVVADAFYNFHPDMVARAIPDAWRLSSPEMVLRARYLAARLALARLLPKEAESDIATALGIIRKALVGLDLTGRPLAAAWGGLPWPEDPVLALWHGCTLWREYRGDGHVAALIAEDIGPVQAHLLSAGSGASTEEMLRVNRGWSEEEWEAGRRNLIDRGLMDGSALTSEGRAVRERVEQLTDAGSAEPWRRLSEGEIATFIESMRRLTGHIVRGEGFPWPNPMGLSETEVKAALGGGTV